MRALGTLAAVVAAGSTLLPAAGPAAAATPAQAPEDVQRVLVISVPGLTWSAVQEHELPNIESFLAESATADLAARAVSSRPTPGAAYLTISAGARASSDPYVDGQQLAVDEQSAGSTAGEIFQRRTGTEPAGEFVALAWPALVARNEAQPYGARLGLLADTLHESGLGGAAIGNADGTDSVGRSFDRQVGLAVTRSDGVLAGGELGQDLLIDDVSRPFGQRLDIDEVVEQFTDAWRAPGGQDRGMVVVEASDLARTMRYHDFVSGPRYDALLAQALADTDDMVGRLLAEVDPARDAVLMLAPYDLPTERDLTVVGLQAPDSAAGYLRSASTQRSGFLTLVDIAPTVLGLLGLERPVAMEGRPAEVVPSDASFESKVDRLVALNEASRFREHLLFPTTLVVIVLLAAVCAVAVVLITRRAVAGGWSWLDRAVELTALAVLAMLPMSYLARAFPLERLGVELYWSIMIAGSVVLASAAVALATWRGRRHVALLAMLSVVAAVPLLDVMTGSNLSLGAAFGYSAPGNSRLYGISNYAFGQVSAAACLVAGLLLPGHAAAARRWAGVGLLAAVLVVIGVPVWGSDVGGTLAFTPAVLLFAAFAFQRRIRWRTVAVAGLATMVAVMAFGLLDLARPPDQRAHLGRLFERVGDEGVEPLLDMVERKALAMLGVTSSSFWLAALPVAIAFIVFLARYPGGTLGRIREQTPGLNAGLVAAVAAAALGTLANDSGVIIAGMALTVLTGSLVALSMVPLDQRQTGERLSQVATSARSP